MSTQDAMLFLQATRLDESLRQTIAARRDDIGLHDLVELGARRHLGFAAADLADAFRHDWAIRSLHARRARTPGALPHRD